MWASGANAEDRGLRELAVQKSQKEPGISSGTADHTSLLMRFTLLASSVMAVFFSLGSQALRPWDESIYAEVAKEMLRRHSWFTPYWSFQPWFEKPPLFMWSTALMYQFFGVSEVSARMTTALCGIATILLTFEIGRRLTGNWGGFVAAAILLTNTNFIGMSRFGTIDVPIALFYAVVTYAYLRILEGNPRWWWLVGTACGAALMMKGAGGAAAPLSVALALLLDRQLLSPRELRSPELRNSALLACGIVLPWHLSMLILHGRAFYSEYIGYHVVARMKGIEGHSEPIYFFLLQYWHTFLPLWWLRWSD